MSLRMGARVRRAALAVAMASTVIAFGAQDASAQAVSTGSLSFSGDPGDYISGGGSYSYDVAAGDTLSVSADTADNHVNVSVSAGNGDWWYLDLSAPNGQALAPGNYDGAVRYPFQGTAQPGLSLDGNGRGCNTLTGSFTVQQALFGPNGYVQELDATYVQHCEGGSAALRGAVHITNPAPPAALKLGVKAWANGRAHRLTGNASIGGGVTCSAAASVTVSGRVTEVVHRTIIRGAFSVSVSCVPGAVANWSAAVVPDGTTPFQAGTASVSTQADAIDPAYGNDVTATKTNAVKLTVVK